MTPRSIPSPARRLLALAILATAFLATAGQASASRTQQSIFQDDRMLLAYGTGVQNGALNDMQALGAKVVHADIGWYTLAPSPNSSKPPNGVDLTNPASYRASRWAILDSLVRGDTVLVYTPLRLMRRRTTSRRSRSPTAIWLGRVPRTRS